MKKTLLEFYALFVCFITAIWFIVSFGIFGYSLVQVSKPDFTLSTSDYEKFQSNNAYWKFCESRYSPDCDKKLPRPSEDELTKQRTEEFSSALISEQRNGLQSVVKNLIVMFVNALAFFVHWIIAKRARANAEA